MSTAPDQDVDATGAHRHPPVIVTGMHRSGTSLGASWLAALGIDLGDDLIRADERNPKGKYEEPAIVHMHGRLLTEATRRGELGHQDWGWTASEWIDRSVFNRFDAAVRQLVDRRTRAGRSFGFKDPRASLLLDFWDERVEGARFVLIYRFPWEVADSIQRVGGEVFLDRPEIAYPAWRFYNRQLLDFYRRHGENCVLVSANALPDRPEEFVRILRDKLGLPIEGSVEGLFESRHFRSRDPDDPIVPLVREAYPECVDLLEQLDAAADLSGASLWNHEALPAAPPENPRAVVLIERAERCASLLIETWASIERAAPGMCRVEVVEPGEPDPPVDARYVMRVASGDRLSEGWVGAAVEYLDAHPEADLVRGWVRRYGYVLEHDSRRRGGIDGAVVRRSSGRGLSATLERPALERRFRGPRTRRALRVLRRGAGTVVRALFARRVSDPLNR